MVCMKLGCNTKGAIQAPNETAVIKTQVLQFESHFLSGFDSFLETEVQDLIWPKTSTKNPDLPKLTVLRHYI